MDTYFASPERSNSADITTQVQFINKNPVMSGLLHSLSGLLAVLNQHRQVIAVNDSFLEILGIDNPEEALGLRPGEVLHCIHAEEGPNGCGTSQHCSTCGAAIALVASLGENKPVDRICALTTSKNGTETDIALQVRSQPIELEGEKFLILFLQDITLQQQHAAMQRTFFHDINNMLMALIGATELLSLQNPASELTQIIHHSSLRIKKEIEIEQALSKSKTYRYNPLIQDIAPRQIQKELEVFFLNHPAATDKSLKFSPTFASGQQLKTDLSLLLRILSNMITNGLEASADHETVKINLEEKNKTMTFIVWNSQAIAKDVALRVFQRNFSTKEGSGRGVGTYSMKMFGEKVLGGQVSFNSCPEEGTTFRLTLPC